VQLRRFAERVLLGDSLQDKLFSPNTLVDGCESVRGALPDRPGRPANLPLRSRERPSFPGAASLGECKAAVTALHAFANHELLAIELFALALLRFEDAHPAFRMDLALTLQEEQVHLALYMDRLQALGEPFGCRPLSAFFWDTLAPVDTPEGFCAAMGLTLEQANLDFAGHFAIAFDAVGDGRSARVLRRVLADEIAHVARGLQWFDHHRRPGDRFDAYVAALPAPLTPRRARGPGFAVLARRRAGLDDGFIQRVRAFGASRGRAADLHWLNPPAEVGSSVRAREWIRDLEGTAILRAAPDDVVMVSRRPSVTWLEQISEAGFSVPAIRLLSEGPGPGPLRDMRPWAATAEAASVLAPWGAIVVAPLPDKIMDGELLRRLLPELGLPERLITPDALPVVATDLQEVVSAIAAFRSAGFSRVVFKKALGTSGQGQMRLFEQALQPPQRTWLARALAAGPLRVEPWLDRVLDLSFQLEAGALSGIVRFTTDTTGRFRSAVVEAPNAGLPTALARFWTGDGRDSRWLTGVGERLVGALGPVGPTGVDAFFYRAADGIRLHPFVERNPRVTFGRLALDLRRRLAPGCVGRWTLLGPAELRRSGEPSLGSMAKRLGLALPVNLRGGRLACCGLATSDPAHVRHVLPMLLVAESGAQLSRALSPIIGQGLLPMGTQLPEGLRGWTG
jgi:uncharacterized ferritin-like protein (DUF455 family)